MPVSVIIPPGLSERLVAQATRRAVEAALSVAKEVPRLITERASEMNEDFDGNQMPEKKRPTPPDNKPLVDKGELLDLSRWTVERTGQNEMTVTYQPPEHQTYLLEKATDAGGRKWLAQDHTNPNVKALIGEKMRIQAQKNLK